MSHQVLATPIFDFGACLQNRFPVATGVGFHRDVLVLSLPKIPHYRSVDGTHALGFSKKVNLYRVHHGINDALFEIAPLKSRRLMKTETQFFGNTRRGAVAIYFCGAKRKSGNLTSKKFSRKT